LLGQRSKWVQSPGTLSGFGGAIEPGETASQAATRELAEELAGLSVSLGPGTVTACPLGCGWTYTTHLARVELDRGGILPMVRIADIGETDRIRWVPVASVAKLRNLHPGLAATWEPLRSELERIN